MTLEENKFCSWPGSVVHKDWTVGCTPGHNQTNLPLSNQLDFSANVDYHVKSAIHLSGNWRLIFKKHDRHCDTSILWVQIVAVALAMGTEKLSLTTNSAKIYSTVVVLYTNDKQSRISYLKLFPTLFQHSEEPLASLKSE